MGDECCPPKLLTASSSRSEFPGTDGEKMRTLVSVFVDVVIELEVPGKWGSVQRQYDSN